MKIAHITWSMTIGGIETMLVDIVNEQVKSCEVWVFVVNDYYDENLLGRIDNRVRVTLLNRKPGSKSVWPILKLNVRLLLFNPDVIHCHYENQAPIIKVPFKKVLTIHNTHSKPENYARFDKLFCISNAVKKHTAKQGYPNGIVVYNGIHTESIITKNHSKTQNYKIKKFVCVGRLSRDKGQRVLIEAVNLLVNNRSHKDFTVDLIGDGEERENLESLVNSLGLCKYVKFLGKRPRSWFYPRLKDYDLFILPSISEGFGLSLAEACAAKLPVLSCDLPGPIEVIDGGRLGDTFKAGDNIALADGIERFLSTDKNLSRIEDAYKYVKMHFDVAMTAHAYIRLY